MVLPSVNPIIAVSLGPGSHVGHNGRPPWAPAPDDVSWFELGRALDPHGAHGVSHVLPFCVQCTPVGAATVRAFGPTQVTFVPGHPAGGPRPAGPRRPSGRPAATAARQLPPPWARRDSNFGEVVARGGGRAGAGSHVRGRGARPRHAPPRRERAQRGPRAIGRDVRPADRPDRRAGPYHVGIARCRRTCLPPRPDHARRHRGRRCRSRRTGPYGLVGAGRRLPTTDIWSPAVVPGPATRTLGGWVSTCWWSTTTPP